MQTTHFDIIHAENTATIVHVLLQVLLQVLKDEREWLLRVDDIMQRHYKHKDRTTFVGIFLSQ